MSLPPPTKLMRSGVRLLLERQPGFTVVAEATDGREAVEMVDKVRPDLAILDAQRLEDERHKRALDELRTLRARIPRRPSAHQMVGASAAMQRVYDAVLACDILILSTPIRWNNHSALVQKFVERMNTIENQYSWFGNRMIKNKVVGLIIIGHVDGMQHVAGNLLNFFAWMGFHSPEVSIASWVGENDEDTTKDWTQIQKNQYTQEDLTDMVNSSLRLACSLKKGI